MPFYNSSKTVSGSFHSDTGKGEKIMKNDMPVIPFYINSIAGATVQHRADRYSFGKHLHTSMEIYLIRSGNCSMDIGDTKIQCSKGDFVMIFPNVVHSFYLEGSGECTFYTSIFLQIFSPGSSPARIRLST